MHVKDTRLCASAVQMATNDPALVGIDPFTILTIISTLLPLLQNLFSGCFGPRPTPTEVKQHLAETYTGQSAPGADDGHYDNGTLRPARHHAKHEAKKHHRKITDEQAEAIAIHTLDTIRNSNDDIVAEAMSARW